MRSATKVDAEALAAAQRLKVVARAGVGLDNVDVKAATQTGVMVVNAPTSNIVSAAELAVGLMLAAARHIAPANAALKNGEWKRSKYTGIELYEKTVGIVGLGRIGVLVAQRLSAFGMKVIAYDPYVQAGRAAQMGVRLVALDELLEESDFISVHLPKTPETVGLIGDDAAAPRSSRAWSSSTPPAAASSTSTRSTSRSRRAASRRPASTCSPASRAPTARCSSSRTSWPPRTSAPPPTRPRRRPASRSPGPCGWRCPASSCPDAVNVQGGVIAEDVRPGIPLTEKLGRIFTALAGEVAQQLDVEVRGEITQYDVKVLELAALKGVFADVVEESVSYVNAPLLAAERGVAVRLVTDPESPDHRNLVTLRGTLADGDAGLGVRHPDRHLPAGAARRGRRLRRRHRAQRAPRVPALRGPARAWSARSAGSWARPRSTSPACRWPATPRAGTRWWR